MNLTNRPNIHTQFYIFEKVSGSWSEKTLIPEVTKLKKWFKTCPLVFNRWLGFWVNLSKRGGKDGVALRDFPRAKPKKNPEEQPCQTEENLVLPNSFTQIFILFLIGLRIGPPKMHIRFCIGLQKKPYLVPYCTVRSLAPICRSFISTRFSEPILRQSHTVRHRPIHRKDYSVPHIRPTWQIL